MANIISVAQGKGGSCKTTTSINLAGALIEKGYSVFVGDMDKDKPDSFLWSNRGIENNSLISTVVSKIEEDDPSNKIDELSKNFDFIILDTPPNFQSETFKAILLSDFVLMPSSSSMLDQDSLLEAISIPKMAKKPYKILASRIKKNTLLEKETLSNFFEYWHLL